MATVSSPQLNRGGSFNRSKDLRPEHRPWEYLGDVSQEVRAFLFIH